MANGPLQDSCQPTKNQSLKTFRIYSIVVPSLFFILAVETVYIFMNVPGSLGNAHTVIGKLPKLGIR
jgi:hypothetical protein